MNLKLRKKNSEKLYRFPRFSIDKIMKKNNSKYVVQVLNEKKSAGRIFFIKFNLKTKQSMYKRLCLLVINYLKIRKSTANRFSYKIRN